MCFPANKTAGASAAEFKANKGKHVNPLNYAAVLNTLSRDELRAFATHLGVPRGKDKQDTIKNLVAVMGNSDKVYVKTVVEFHVPPTPEAKASWYRAKGKSLFAKKFRNYRTDKVIRPVPPVEKAAQ